MSKERFQIAGPDDAIVDTSTGVVVCRCETGEMAVAVVTALNDHIGWAQWPTIDSA